MDKKNPFFNFLLIFIALLFLGNRLLIVFDYNPDIEGIEETFVNYVLRVAQGQPLYTNPETPPFANCQYAPLYFELNALVLNVCSIDTQRDLHTVYTVFRFLNLLFNLGTVFLIYWLIKKYGNNDGILAVPVSAFAFIFFTAHSYAIRPDSFKTLLLVVSLCFFIAGTYEKKNILLIISVLVAAIASLVKQDAIIFLAMLNIMLLFDFRKNYPLILLSVLTVFLLQWLMYFAYGENYFLNLLIGFKFKYDFFYALKQVFVPGIFRLIILFSGLYFFWLMRSENAMLYRVITALILGIGATLFIANKWGAKAVYFTDIMLFCLTLFAIFYKGNVTTRAKAIAFLFAMAAMIFDVAIDNVYLYSRANNRLFKEYYTDCMQVSDTLKDGMNESDYLVTADKMLANRFIKQALFPNYETEFPLLLLQRGVYQANFSSTINPFPSLPGVMFDYKSVERVRNRVKYLVVAKTAEKPDFPFIEKDDYVYSSSSKYFDIYKRVD